MKIDILSRISDSVKRHYENTPRKVEPIEKVNTREVKTPFEDTLSYEDKLLFMEELRSLVVEEQYKEGYARPRCELREELITLWKTR